MSFLTLHYRSEEKFMLLTVQIKMKKIICGVIALISASVYTEVCAEPYWPDDIRVEEVVYPVPTTIGRKEIVDASLDRVGGKVDIEFKESVAEVVVSIVDQSNGMVVSQNVCDTANEMTTTLDAPAEEGAYMLHIQGESYEGIGYFEM